jgi:hypothetical protein
MKSSGKFSRVSSAIAVLASFAVLAALAPGAHQHDPQLTCAGPASTLVLPSWIAADSHGSDSAGPSGVPDSKLCVFCKWSRAGLRSPEPNTHREKEPPVLRRRPTPAPRMTDDRLALHILLRAPPTA